MITVLAVVAVVVAVLALVAGVLALTTLGRLRRGVGLLGRGANHSRESFIEASARHAEAADRTRTDLDAFRTWVLAELDEMRAGLAAVDGARQAELDHVADAERTDRGRHLDLVQQQMETDFVAIRAELARLHAELSAETQAERARLATDNSATRDQLRGAVDKVEKVIATALRRVALVRYDAFDDLGGGCRSRWPCSTRAETGSP